MVVKPHPVDMIQTPSGVHIYIISREFIRNAVVKPHPIATIQNREGFNYHKLPCLEGALVYCSLKELFEQHMTP